MPGDEIWLPVYGFEASYEVSDRGRVRSVDRLGRDRWGERVYRGQLLKPSPHPDDGHLRVALYREGIRSRHMVHHLVLEAFVGPCPEGMEGCHSDGDPSNNVVGNLRWDTHAENIRDQFLHGTNYNSNKTACLRGHAYTESNTYLYQGCRYCRECGRQRAAARRERKAAA